MTPIAELIRALEQNPDLNLNREVHLHVLRRQHKDAIKVFNGVEHAVIGWRGNDPHLFAPAATLVHVPDYLWAFHQAERLIPEGWWVKHASSDPTRRSWNFSLTCGAMTVETTAPKAATALAIAALKALQWLESEETVPEPCPG